MKIITGGLDHPSVRDLLEQHVRTARLETALGSAHALDLEGLKAADMTLWSAWDDDVPIAVGALKRLSPTHGEVKSMHTVQTRRRAGVGTTMLRHIIDSARIMGMKRLSLETGSWAYFHPARAMYRRHGFVECASFGEYVEDPNSIFMTLELARGAIAHQWPLIDERTRGQAILPDAHGGTMVDDGISHRAPPPEGVAPQVDPIDNAFFELFNGRLRNECLNVPIHVDRRCEAEDRSVAH